MATATEDTALLGGSDAPSSVGLDSVYGDPPQHMTLGRRLARFLSGWKWYNPHVPTALTEDNAVETTKPSLDASWAYFEHWTLSRYFVRTSEEEDRDVLVRAAPGTTEPTRLYPIFSTAEADLADFGIGVGVYFFTLRALSIIMFLAGILNLPNMMYFNSPEYSQEEDDSDKKDVKFMALRTSAICTDSTWVACPTCTREQWDRFPATYERYAEAVVGDDGSNTTLTFLLRNNCDLNTNVALYSFVSLLFICISIYVLQKMTKGRERYLDDAAQTSTDYSVEVQNPPKDARDPDEWEEFFGQFGHVTSCTVALDNEELVAALLERRQLILQLEGLQPPGVVVDRAHTERAVETAAPVPWYLQWMGKKEAAVLQEQISALNELIETDLAQRKYDVSHIFVMFETESAQQTALKELAVSGLNIVTNNTSALFSSHLFRKRHVLAVREPCEPSSVRWEDLDENWKTRLQQRLITFVVTAVIIIGACILVTYVRFRYGLVYAAMSISILNSISPTVCAKLTEYESHASEGSKQASLYYKITACIWTISALITPFVTAFVHTLDYHDDALIPAMLAIFITELLKDPIKQLLDLPGNVKRHILGPRAPDQKRMNTYFQGSSWTLSERYTDMTNVLFMTFFYAFLFPVGFFLAAATLAIRYWTDKICLLRVWAPVPMLGSKIADMSRIYFFSIAVAVYAIISSYNLASFPYDNACEGNTVVSSDYIGSFQAVDGEGGTVDVEISQGDTNYFYCNQDMLRSDPMIFPAIPSNQPENAEWMPDDQRVYAFVFGWTSVGVLVVVALIFLNAFRRLLWRVFVGTFQQHSYLHPNKSLSKLPGICGYIPQAKLAGDLFPTLLCDVSEISPELIGWQDTDQTYREHNAIYDLPCLTKDAGESLFSVIQHWPPPEE